jgi:hypothetical protein
VTIDVLRKKREARDGGMFKVERTRIGWVLKVERRCHKRDGSVMIEHPPKNVAVF